MLVKTISGTLGRAAIGGAQAVGNINLLFWETVRWSVAGWRKGRGELRRQTFPLMEAIGNRSIGIVALIAFLIGIILVLQTAYVLMKYGMLHQIPGLVSVSMTRELGPLMTAIVITARVGAAFTAGLGSMKMSQEILALKTMGISPVGYLVAPRFVAICVMLPCLTIMANVIGMIGGCVIATVTYDMDPWQYMDRSIDFLVMKDLLSGLVKSFAFAVIICMISCYMGLTVEGGPEGVGRNTMRSVVTTLVVIIFTDSLFTALLTNVL